MLIFVHLKRAHKFQQLNLFPRICQTHLQFIFAN